jgi:hypothetical protein
VYTREHLIEAERHAALSDKNIAWQIDIIDELRPTSNAPGSGPAG